MDDGQPIFMQIMERIENDIITGIYNTDDLIVSTTQISKLYSVNPTTAMKAVSKLTDEGILYKRRGIGMCVAAGAKEAIIKRRRTVFFTNTIDGLLAEAKNLGVSSQELLELIKERQERNDKKKETTND